MLPLRGSSAEGGEGVSAQKVGSGAIDV